MQMRIERIPNQPATAPTAGVLYVDDVPYAQTIEPAAGEGKHGQAVPTGSYHVRLLHREHREWLLLHRVPNGPVGASRVMGTQMIDGTSYEVKGDWRTGLVLRDGTDADANGDIVLGPIGAAIPFDADAARDLYDGLLRRVREAGTMPAGVWLTVIVPGAPQTVSVAALDLTAGSGERSR